MSVSLFFLKVQKAATGNKLHTTDSWFMWWYLVTIVTVPFGLCITRLLKHVLHKADTISLWCFEEKRKEKIIVFNIVTILFVAFFHSHNREVFEYLPGLVLGMGRRWG